MNINRIHINSKNYNRFKRNSKNGITFLAKNKDLMQKKNFFQLNVTEDENTTLDKEFWTVEKI